VTGYSRSVSWRPRPGRYRGSARPASARL